MSRYSDNFWEGNGFANVIAHLKASKSLDFVATLLHERSSVELEYTKQLHKISKRFESVNEIGSIQGLFDGFKNEIDKEIELRSKFGTDLKSFASDIEKSLKEFKKQQKTQLSEIDKLNKEFKSLTSKVASTQTKYHKICNDNSQLEAKLAREVDPKTTSKLQQSLTKGQKSQSTAEQEYQVAIQKQCSFQPQYIEKNTSHFDALQSIEQQKKDMIKSSFQRYINSLSAMDRHIPETIEFLQNMTNLVNPSQDIDLWIMHNKTGPNPPEEPQFIPFGSTPPPSDSSSSNGISITRIDKPDPSQNSNTGSIKIERIDKPSSVPVVDSPTIPVVSSPSTQQDNQEEYQAGYGEEHQEEYQEEYEYQEGYEEEYQEEYEYQEGYGEEYEGEWVVAIWDYDALEENEISFRAGENILIVGKEDVGWWTGQNENGDIGLFPANYTKAAE